MSNPKFNSPKEAWDIFVGNCSPMRFMEMYSFATVEDAVELFCYPDCWEYDEPPTPEIKQALIDYINNHLEDK